MAQLQRIDNNHSDQEPSSERQMISIKKSIPKPNELVNSQLKDKKSLYSFDLQAFYPSLGPTSPLPLFKVRPPSPTNPKIISHLSYLSHNDIIYDRMNSGLDNISEESLYPISKIKLLAEYESGLKGKPSQPFVREDNLQFDSAIQSGNLNIVCKGINNEYDLLLRNDVNTKGYNNWFYFRVKNKQSGLFKFNILNYKKSGTLFNHGAGILTYSESAFSNNKVGWVRAGTNIGYNKNGIKFDPDFEDVNFTLTFEYEFQSAQDTVYFSYSYPYTYTQLCDQLLEIQRAKLPFFHRKLLTRSLDGNRVQLLTITSPSDNFEKRAIVVMARTHPGESCSSWVLKGFLDLIISDSKEARDLRDRFIFKIVPMLNPDGVIHGNFRCSLSGRDLNRVWKRPNKQTQPEVYYAKQMIEQIWSKKGVWMMLDLHGHSRLKKIFMYGCGTGSNYVKCREFPFLLSKLNPNFQYKSCNFSIQNYKQSTARVSFFRKFRIPRIYTLQASVCGNNQHHFTTSDYEEMGRTLIQATHIYSQPSRANGQKAMLLNQLRSNDDLLRSGNDPDGGSESEPSLDNIVVQQDPSPAQKPSAKFVVRRQSLYSSNNSRSREVQQKTQQYFNPMVMRQRSTMSEFPRSFGSTKVSPARPGSKIQGKNQSQLKLRQGTTDSGKQAYNFIKTQVFVLNADFNEQYQLLETAAVRFRRFLRSSKTKKLVFKAD